MEIHVESNRRYILVAGKQNWEGERDIGKIINQIYERGEKNEVKKLQRCDINGYNVHNTSEYFEREIEKEIYEKLQEGQFGFRIERDTIDSTYALNFVVNKDLSEKRGRIFAFFTNLKAAFDKVGEGKLEQMIKRIRNRIENQMRRKMMRTYKTYKYNV